MLEFLKECPNKNIYDRAMDLERSLTRVNCISCMNTFCEVLFKELYFNYTAMDKRKIDCLTLYSLLSEQEFINYVNLKLNFSDIFEIKNIIRPEGNKSKHSTSYKVLEYNKVLEYFKIIYNLSCCYYKYLTGKIIVPFSEDSFEFLYNSNTSFDDLRLKIPELESNIRQKDSYIKELSTLLDNKRKEIDIKNKEIERLTKFSTDGRIKELKAKILEIEKDRNKVINQKQELNAKLKKAVKLIKNYENNLSDLQLTNSNSIIQNQELKLEIEKLTEEVEKYSKQIIALEDALWELEEEKKALENQRDIEIKEKEQEIKKLQEQILDLNEQLKQNKNTIVDKIISKNNQVEIKLLNKINQIEAKAPYCPECKNKMNLTFRNDIFYSCDFCYKVKKKKIPARPVNSYDKNEYYRIKEELNEVQSNVENYKEKVLSINNINTPESRNEFFYNTLNIPSRIFIENNLNLFSKFTYFKFKTAFEKKNIPTDIRLVYSLCLRLLNRGKVLKLPSTYEGYLIDKFPADELSNLNLLNDKIENNQAVILKSNEKLMLASKIFGQLSIVLVKCLELGIVTDIETLKPKYKSDLLTEEEIKYVFDLSKKHVAEIIVNFSNLYGLSIDSTLIKENDCRIEILIGNESDCDIFIEDIALNHDFLCNIQSFNSTLKPCCFTKENLTYFLTYIFNHEDFNEGQYESLIRLLQKKDSIILLPTGAGKSIIYQLSSYLVPGLIIVVSPLKSLIDDQITNLYIKHGISNAIGIHSGIDDKAKALFNIKNNSTSLIYLAPERLQITRFRLDIKSILEKNSVYCVAVDEVHCVSEWGHDFRPSYLNVGRLSKELFCIDGNFPVLIGLTGTASNSVLNDIKRDLGITDEDAIVAPTSFDRSELKFYVKEYNTEEDLNKLLFSELPKMNNCLLEEFYKLKGNETNCGIIFTATTGSFGRYGAVAVKERLIEYLQNINIDTKIKIENYFSKKPDYYDNAITWEKTIKRNSIEFKNNESNILVATKAYGTGIDKGNIRFIVHNCLPHSIEQYYQEAGRAGRDRKVSNCFILFTKPEKNLEEIFFDGNTSLENLRVVAGNNYDDDLNVFISFHLGNFRGINEDMSIIDYLFDNLGRQIENYNDCALFILNGTKSDDYNKKISQGLIRLKILSIVKDYTYDYSTKKFQIYINYHDQDDIINAYIEYVKACSPGRIYIEQEKINEICKESKDLNDFSKKACRILIEYIYDNVELSRRNAFKNLFTLIKQASNLSMKEQNEKIRSAIISYFNQSDDITTLLNSICSDPDCGFELITQMLNLDNPEKIYSETSVKTFGDISYSVLRRLENPVDSNNAGLLFLSALCQIIGQYASHQVIKENIIMGYKFGIEKYGINQQKMMDMVMKTLNLVIKRSLKLFNELCDFFTEELKSNVSFYEMLINSNRISKDYIDFILLNYIINKI